MCDMDRAFRLLQQAAKQHDNSLPYTTLVPMFERLKTGPRAGEVFKHLRLSV